MLPRSDFRGPSQNYTKASGVSQQVDESRTYRRITKSRAQLRLNRSVFRVYNRLMVGTKEGSLIDRDHAGRPKIAGTGVTVMRVAAFYKMGQSPESIAAQCGHFGLDGVNAALAYYQANRTEIDADLAREEALDNTVDSKFQVKHAIHCTRAFEVEEFWGPCLICNQEMRYACAPATRWGLHWICKQFEPTARDAHVAALKAGHGGRLDAHTLFGLLCISCQLKLSKSWKLQRAAVR
jgi:uncharacterized protein (DUF433 family)